MVPAGVLEGFSFADKLGEGRGKNGENYPKTPPSRNIAGGLVKGVVKKVGVNERTIKAIVFID